MADEISRIKKEQQLSLERCLENAGAIITKEYLSRLETYDIAEPSEEDTDTDIAECGRFYRLTRLVIDRKESFLDKLTTVVNVASAMDCSIATILRSDGSEIRFYFGILSRNAREAKDADARRREADGAAFRGALSGNLTGSGLEELSKEEIASLREQCLSPGGNCCAAVSGIASFRDRDDRSVESYVQGIENLADSLKGRAYTIVMLADPMDTPRLQTMKQGYEILHTQLSVFARSSLTFNESDTLSLSDARTEGISEGISQGIAMTQSRTRSKGKSFGASANAALKILGTGVGVSVNSGRNSSVSDTSGRTDSTTRSSQSSRSQTRTESASGTTGKSLQLNYENRTIKALLDQIDRNLERLDECRSFGAFDCAAYVIAQDRETALAVAGNYSALMRGRNSAAQSAHINSWFRPEDTRILARYMTSLVHPRFRQDGQDGIYVTPALPVSGSELAIQMGLPKKSLAGIPVIPMASFGRNIPDSAGETLTLGNLYHMGREEAGDGGERKVRLDLESLSMHTFITGSTGKGKSTTVYAMLDQLMRTDVKGTRDKIRFLVIEPAKGEYKDRFGSYPDVNVYGTNDRKTPLLRMNPFSFPEDIHVLEHIDRLIEIFNVCWPMYAAMPAVLKDAVERSYETAGWNLEISECRYRDREGRPLFPTFQDVLSRIREVMNESEYSSDSKGDYKGALCTRLKSLTNGLYRQIFTPDELSPEELFDSNVIVDLSRTGSAETRALIMGLLVMKLQEHRMARAVRGNAPLRHVTVLEEAHHILKRTSGEQSEGAGMQGKSVEMLANSIAEMRTYGEGFLIADQAPGLMDLSAIRNTNTKIILGLPDLEDRELVGRAAGLNEEQILELSRLKAFVAAVYQNNWEEPVLCRIDAGFRTFPPYEYDGKKKDGSTADRNRFLEYLLLPPQKRQELDDKYIEGLAEGIYRLSMPSEARIAFLQYMKSRDAEELQKLRAKALYGMFNAETAFRHARGTEERIEDWYARVREALVPEITMLRENDQQKIIVSLAMERSRMEGGSSEELCGRLIDYI